MLHLYSAALFAVIAVNVVAIVIIPVTIKLATHWAGDGIRARAKKEEGPGSPSLTTQRQDIQGLGVSLPQWRHLSGSIRGNAVAPLQQSMIFGARGGETETFLCNCALAG